MEEDSENLACKRVLRVFGEDWLDKVTVFILLFVVAFNLIYQSIVFFFTSIPQLFLVKNVLRHSIRTCSMCTNFLVQALNRAKSIRFIKAINGKPVFKIELI